MALLPETVQIINGQAVIKFTATADETSEGSETLAVTIKNADGVVLSTAEIQVKDS